MTFKNAHLSVGSTGLTDNSALHLFNTFWVWIYGGELTGTHSAPDLLLTGDNCGGSCNDAIGDLYINGTLMGNGNVQYIQRANATGAPPGHWVFQNITQEGGDTDLISISDPGGYAMGGLGPITLDDVQSVDNSDGTAAVINFNAPGNTLTGVEMRHVLSGNGPNAGPAIKVTAGAVQNFSIDACNDVCSTQVVNSSGQPIGDGFAEGSAGLDFFSTRVLRFCECEFSAVQQRFQREQSDRGCVDKWSNSHVLPSKRSGCAADHLSDGGGTPIYTVRRDSCRNVDSGRNRESTLHAELSGQSNLHIVPNTEPIRSGFLPAPQFSLVGIKLEHCCNWRRSGGAGDQQQFSYGIRERCGNPVVVRTNVLCRSIFEGDDQRIYKWNGRSRRCDSAGNGDRH